MYSSRNGYKLLALRKLKQWEAASVELDNPMSSVMKEVKRGGGRRFEHWWTNLRRLNYKRTIQTLAMYMYMYITKEHFFIH